MAVAARTARRSAVEVLVYLLDAAFAGPGTEWSGESQALLPNLSGVGDELWRSMPPAGSRTIEAMVLHVGSCKVMYDEYAFGSGRLFWDHPAVQPWPVGEAPMADAIEWLKRAHRQFVEHVAALTDADLQELRPTNWGERRETRWIVASLIQHDTYHAGEINYIRSLASGDDRWMHEREQASGS